MLCSGIFSVADEIIDENLVVKKMGLFATVFTRVDGTESYYFNSQLFTKFMYVSLVFFVNGC